jgi:hypothetical protein
MSEEMQHDDRLRGGDGLQRGDELGRSDELRRSDDLRQAIEKRKRRQVAINAFHRTFGTKDGRLVLELLRAAFKTDQPAFLNLAGREGGVRYDALHAAKRDGQRDVLLQIEAYLAQPIEGDGNVETAKPRVRAK